MNFLELHLSHRKSDSNMLPDFRICIINGYYIIGPDNKPLVKLRKRDEYPRTYAHQTTAHAIVLGYGPEDPGPTDEFLQITIHHNGDVRIVRDIRATLPLFYGNTTNGFTLSNDYKFVLEASPIATLNETGLFNALIPNSDMRTTFWNEINILGEREILELSKGGLVTHQPVGRDWQSSREAARTDPHEFKRVLTGHLDAFIDSFVCKEGFAFEISGGLDSTLLPLYYAHTNPYSIAPPFGALIVPDEFGVTQCEKMREITALTQSVGTMIVMNPATEYPLARMLEPYSPYAHYCFDEIYMESFEKLATTLSAQGVRTIATGIGGDELFENTTSASDLLHYGEKERKLRQATRYPSYMTDTMRVKYIELTPETAPYPLPLLGVPLYGAQNSRNNIYISHDIWPISPFVDVALYEYCQGLPAHFRANKNVLRALYAAYNFPSSIYDKVQNEHFGVFFNKCMSTNLYDELINTLARSSVTGKLGLVNVAGLLRTHEACKRALDTISKADLFYIYEWINIELNLQRYK